MARGANHLDAQLGVQVVEAEKGRPAAGRHKAQERLLLLWREALQRLLAIIEETPQLSASQRESCRAVP